MKNKIMKIFEIIINKKILLLNLFVIATCSFLFARAINISLIPNFAVLEKQNKTSQKSQAKNIPNKRQSKSEYKYIVKRNIFDSENALAAMVEEERSTSKKVLTQTGVKTTLDAKLLGTLVLNDPSMSIAIIEFKGEIDSYMIEDSFSDATVVRIRRNIVEFNRNDHLEYLESEGMDIFGQTSDNKEGSSGSEGTSKGIVKKGENQFEISREKLDATLSDLNSILRQARAIPHIVNGITEGFKIVAIKPDSIYRQLGIRNGDVIQRVNGSEINNIESSLTLFQTLRNESNFSIDLKRRGKKETFSYEVK
ncbi:MAG: type II secretion system protein GspC [Pseudomonadota bacterium]